MSVSAPGGADTDIFVLAFLACSAAVLLRTTPSERPRADVVAAVAAGVAAGCKLTGLAIAVVLAVGAVASASRRRAAVAGVWGGVLVVTGSFWYLRDCALAHVSFMTDGRHRRVYR
jgi:hypothetical protein